MKKRDLIVAGVALAGSVVGMVNMQAAYAAINCTAGTASTPMTCSSSTGSSSYLAEELTFTGSNGVQMGTSDAATGVQLCGSHISGKNAYGLTTDGGSMEVKSGGTGTGVGAGGCS